MKIGVASYPMLWQRGGGLQVQIGKTVEALAARGHDIRVFDAGRERLDQFDLIHVFSAINGMHRVVEEALAQGVKSIVSALVHPGKGRWVRGRYAVASWITARISNYELRTTFDQIRSALDRSHYIIALSEVEKRALMDIYSQPAVKIAVIPNGIDQRFCAADAAPFRERYAIREKFVLVVGSISSYKNQLGVIRATGETGWPVILLGHVQDDAYLARCLEEGGARVSYLGTIPHGDPLLASAYGAAGVTVLASAGESFGLAAVESLAAGTPVVITRANGLDMAAAPPILTYIDPRDLREMAQAIAAAMGSGRNAKKCRELVAGLSWDQVARKIEEVYHHAAAL